MFPVVFSFFEAVRERQPPSPEPSRREGAVMKKFTLAAVAAFAAFDRVRRSAADLPVKARSQSSRRRLRRGISRSVRRSPAITFSAASRSRTTSRRSRLISSRATTSTRTCSSTPASAAQASSSRTARRLKSTSTPAIRPTFGKFAFDFGVWYYWYPGGQCFSRGRCQPATARQRRSLRGLPNGNAIKGDLSFCGSLRQGELHRHRNLQLGAYVYYSP